MIKWIVSLACMAALMADASASSAGPEVVKDLAPTGRLRAAINYGNPVLAQRESNGELKGVSVDLARELGRRLGVAVDLVPFDTAGKVSDSATTNAWDIAFLAIDPARRADIAFTAPYVLIEGTYMVPKDSALQRTEDVDREGVRVAVGAKSAYDLYLTRTIKRAELVRAPTSQAAVDIFMREKLEVAAGVKQPLVHFAATNPGLRVMDGRFMAIEQAMGAPKARETGVAYLKGFVEEMKASGFVAEALTRSNQKDAIVAPPASR